MARTPKLLTAAQYQALLTGIPKYCVNTIFSYAGQTYTASQAVAVVTALLNVSFASSNAKSAWKDALAAEQKMIAADAPVVRAIRESLALTFVNAQQTLTELGITPRKKPTPLPGAARSAATAKAAATRKARGTTSKKQKALVTGNVTGVTITPVATTATGAAPAATTPAATPPSTAASTGTGAVSPATPTHP